MNSDLGSIINQIITRANGAWVYSNFVLYIFHFVIIATDIGDEEDFYISQGFEDKTYSKKDNKYCGRLYILVHMLQDLARYPAATCKIYQDKISQKN